MIVGASTAAWVALAICALMVGVSKTALPGLATVPVTVAALLLPARSSTTVILILFLVGDIWAVSAYRQNVAWKTLLRLIPSVLIGVALGALFLGSVSDSVMKKAIGIILLALTSFTVLVMRRTDPKTLRTRFGKPSTRWFYGTLGGFTTMTANSGGPAINLYFLASGFPVKRFIATQAWFFFVVNLIKVPFQIGVGLMTKNTVFLALSLIPFVLVGCWAGIKLADRIPQKAFDAIIIVLTFVTSLMLVVL